jgi:hypothetical protein
MTGSTCHISICPRADEAIIKRLAVAEIGAVSVPCAVAGDLLGAVGDRGVIAGWPKGWSWGDLAFAPAGKTIPQISGRF